MPTNSLPAPSSPPRVVFAGDRDVAVDVLKSIADDVKIVGLLLSAPDQATHDDALLEGCRCHPDRVVLRGEEARSPKGIQQLRDTNPDFLLCVHFPYFLPEPLLRIPRVAPLNLHPAYLPYNRGWHTPSWALLDDTPYGATLHVMTETLDAGPVVHRERLAIRPHDTAHSLYQRVKRLEVRIFRKTWPKLCEGTATLTEPEATGTEHTKRDLHHPSVQRINLDEHVRAGDLLTQLRALTTNRPGEAAYVEHEGMRYHIQVKITPKPVSSDG